LPLLERVQLPLGQVLYEPGVVLKHIYFPINAIVSLLYVMEDGASAEIAVDGNEGLVGVSLLWAVGRRSLHRRPTTAAGYQRREGPKLSDPRSPQYVKVILSTTLRTPGDPQAVFATNSRSDQL
jgi:hypothetical protein